MSNPKDVTGRRIVTYRVDAAYCITPMDGPYMPTLNKKLLLRLVLIALVLGTGMFVLNYVQSDRVTDALRWQAEHAAEGGRQDKAIYYMKQYLELRPNDHEAAVKLGELIQSKGQGRRELTNVLFLYERVLREAPDRHDLRRKLVDICLSLNRYGDAMIHAKAMLDRSPDDADLWEKLGTAQTSQNKHDDARSSFQMAIECDARRIRSYELLAELQIRYLQLANEGRDTIERMVKANPSSSEAFLVRARYLRSQNKLAECVGDIGRLLTLDPENADALLMLAELSQQKQDLAAARDLLADGMNLHQKDLRFYRALSWLELSSGNLPAGIACLEQGIKHLPNAAELLAPLGDLYVQQGDVERVRAISQKLEGRRGYDGQSKYLNARLLMMDSRWNDAVAALEVIRNQAVNQQGLKAQINLLLATCHEKLASRDGEIEALKRVIDVDTGNLSARLKFGALYLASGEIDKAIAEYAVAARSPFAPLSARVMLGRLMIARARTAAVSPDWNSIADYVKALRDKHKSAVEPVLVEAELLMARSQYDSATKLLREEAGRKLNDARIWSVLAAIALEAEGIQAASGVVDEAQRLIGDQVELRLARARIRATDWQSGREERLRTLGRSANHFSEADQYRLALGMTEICASIRDFEGLKQFQKQVAQRLPGDLLIRRGLYESALRTGDDALQQAVRLECERLQGESLLTIADALHEVSRSPTTERLGRLQVLANEQLKSNPNRADVHLLLAWLAERSGNQPEALQQYARAISLEPGNLTIMEAHLAFLLQQTDSGSARKRIEQLFADPRMSGEAFLGLIEGATANLTGEQRARCMRCVEPLIGKSGVSMIWLARMEHGRGRAAEARVLAAKACAAYPQLVDAWIAHVRVNGDSAVEQLKKARGILNDKAWFGLCAETLDVARGLQADWLPEFKQPTDRRLFAQAKLNASLARGKLDEAASQLNLLIDNAETFPAEAAWARQNLALITASRGGTNEGQKAAALLKELPMQIDASLDDRRARAASLALAAQNLTAAARRTLLQKAIESMRLVSVSPDAIARDWFQLAQLYRQMGDRASSETAIKEAMRRDENNLHYVLARIEDLLTDGRLEEVEFYVPRLTGAMHDPRAAGTLCRYYAQANLPTRAIETIDRYVRTAEPGTADGPARMRQAADMLDRAARASFDRNLSGGKAIATAAIDRYRLCLKSFPDAVGPLSLLLAVDGQSQQALDALVAMKATMSSAKWLPAAVAVLQVGTSGPRQFQQVKGWIDAALAAEPESGTFKLCLAEYHALRHEYAAAEPLYRDILKAEPDNVVALNNLAYILAPRGEALDEAFQNIERAMSLAGLSGELLDTRARVQIARGNYDRAIEDLNQAIEFGPTSLRYFHLSIAQSKQLKKIEAIQSFREARSRGLDPKMIHPTDMGTYRVLAAQMGD